VRGHLVVFFHLSRFAFNYILSPVILSTIEFKFEDALPTLNSGAPSPGVDTPYSWAKP